MKTYFFMSVNLMIGFLWILLPWIIIIGYVSKPIILVMFIAIFYGIVIIGKVLIENILVNFTEEEKWFIALPIGYMTVCGAACLLVKLGISPSAIFWTFSILAATCSIWLFIRQNPCYIPGVPGLPTLALLSLAIALLYYLHGAKWDAVYLSDGGFHWVFVDTQYFHAIASSVKDSIGAPRMPGTSFVDLNYHFASYGFAGIISSVIPITVGDALVRVVRPLSLISLILSTFVAGRFLARQVGQYTIGGQLAVAGLFFYGSFSSFINMSIFSNLINSPTIQKFSAIMQVQNSGGIFSHLFMGHSQVNGMNALLVFLVILLTKMQERDNRSLNPDLTVLGPAIIFPFSILLGFASLGLYMVLIIWFGRRYKRTWVTAIFAFSAAILSAYSMGYLNTLASGNMVGFAPIQTLIKKFPSAFIWFYFGLGFRIYAFTKIKDPLNEPVCAALIILFTGLLATDMFIPDPDAMYGSLFAQAILGIFAFSWISSFLNLATNRNWIEVFIEIKKIVKIILLSNLIFLILGILIFLYSYNSNVNFSDHSAPILKTIFSSMGLAVFSAAIIFIFKRKMILRPIITTIMISFYSLGFLAWVPVWVELFFNGHKYSITISKEEVEDLEYLKNISSKGDLVAANRHYLPEPTMYKKAISYAYGAISERTVLVEGWDYSFARNSPVLKEVLMDNQMIFEANDPNLVRAVIDKYSIKYIVTRPDTDLGISKALPDWLSKIPGTKILNIYHRKY